MTAFRTVSADATIGERTVASAATDAKKRRRMTWPPECYVIPSVSEGSFLRQNDRGDILRPDDGPYRFPPETASGAGPRARVAGRPGATSMPSRRRRDPQRHRHSSGRSRGATDAKGEQSTGRSGALRATPRLVQALTKLTQYSGYADFHRFGREQASAWPSRSKARAGCQYITFYATKPDGSSDDRGRAAGGAARQAGGRADAVQRRGQHRARSATAGGDPAFIVENGVDQAERNHRHALAGRRLAKGLHGRRSHYGATFTIDRPVLQGRRLREGRRVGAPRWP